MNFLLITFNRNELAAKGSPEGPERIRKEHVLCSMRYRSRGTRGRVCSSMWTGKGSHRDFGKRPRAVLLQSELQSLIRPDSTLVYGHRCNQTRYECMLTL